MYLCASYHLARSVALNHVEVASLLVQLPRLLGIVRLLLVHSAVNAGSFAGPSLWS